MVQSETLRVVYCEPAFFLFLGGGGLMEVSSMHIIDK